MSDSATESRHFHQIKREILSAIREIRTSRRSRLKIWPCMVRYLDELTAFANYHPIGWQPKYEGIGSIETTPRTGDLVFANFYTSEKYPWPRHEQTPLAPLLQIDLNTIRKKFQQSGQTGKFPDIDGLLQVWTRSFRDRNFREANGDGEVRVIPRADISMKLMTDERPNIIADDYPGTADAGYGSDIGFGAKIIGWKKNPPMYMHISPSHSDSECEPTSETERDALIVETDDDIVGQLAEPVACRGRTHLFGVSVILNLGPSEWERYLSGWQNLFQFDGDGDYDYRISGFGVGMVCWNGDKFQFMWSDYR